MKSIDPMCHVCSSRTFTFVKAKGGRSQPESRGKFKPEKHSKKPACFGCGTPVQVKEVSA